MEPDGRFGEWLLPKLMRKAQVPCGIILWKERSERAGCLHDCFHMLTWDDILRSLELLRLASALRHSSATTLIALVLLHDSKWVNTRACCPCHPLALLRYGRFVLQPFKQRLDALVLLRRMLAKRDSMATSTPVVGRHHRPFHRLEYPRATEPLQVTRVQMVDARMVVPEAEVVEHTSVDGSHALQPCNRQFQVRAPAVVRMGDVVRAGHAI